MRISLAALLLLAGSACATPPWQRATLYEDLGGEPGLARIVDAFLDRLAADERIVHFFERTHVERFERMLTEQLCELADGPCAYSGDSMADAHRGLGIGEAHFHALVEDLQGAMEDVDVPWRVQNRLLARLAPLEAEIVEGDPCSAFAVGPAKRERCAALGGPARGTATER